MNLYFIYNAITHDLNLDTDSGHRTRHYRICCAVIIMGYVAWGTFVQLAPHLIHDMQIFRITNLFSGMIVLISSYRFSVVKEHIEKFVFINLLGVLAHCIVLTQINQNLPGVWLTSYMGFACSAILIRKPRLLFFYLFAGILGFSLTNILGYSSEHIYYFIISTVILGITLLSTVHEDVWSMLTLNEKNHKISKMNQQQSFVIEQLSHDLKTPLVPLVGLLSDIKTADEISAKKLKLCVQSADHLASCIRQIASYASVANANLMHPKKVTDLTTLVQKTAHRTFDFMSGGKSRIQFNSTLPIHAPVDAFLIEQLITNLLSNAVKFSDENSPINIDLTLENNKVCLRVTDHGIGMTADEARRIFEPFYCADTARSKKNSTGLGLTICQKIVEIHFGTIEVESTAKGKGTTLKVELPTTVNEPLPLMKEA